MHINSFIGSLSKEHIKNVLGIDVSLNESHQLSEDVISRIIEAQLLYENFLSSLKDYAKEKVNKAVSTIKDWKDSAVLLYKILSDENTLSNFSDNLWKTFKNSSVLKTLYSKIGNIKIGETAISEYLDALIKKITSLKGWPKFVAASGIATAGKFLYDTLGKLDVNKIIEYVKNYLSDEALTKITTKILSGGFGALVSWFEAAKIGVQTLYNTLAPTIKKFSAFIKEIKDMIKEAEEIIKCKNEKCNHQWSLSDGGKDPYMCHLCGTDNSPIEELHEGEFCPRCLIEYILEHRNILAEAKYKGRTVQLGKPMAGDVKKFKVYVKNKSGKVIKVNFGQKGVKIKKSNPARRKSFRARHKCSTAKDRTTPRYWSCRKW
jgi:hypothetical protein